MFKTSLFVLQILLTLIPLEPKVISLSHQYRARPACISVQSDQAVYCSPTLSSHNDIRKMKMDSSKNEQKWNIQFKKFSSLRVNSIFKQGSIVRNSFTCGQSGTGIMEEVYIVSFQISKFSALLFWTRRFLKSSYWKTRFGQSESIWSMLTIHTRNIFARIISTIAHHKQRFCSGELKSKKFCTSYKNFHILRKLNTLADIFTVKRSGS